MNNVKIPKVSRINDTECNLHLGRTCGELLLYLVCRFWQRRGRIRISEGKEEAQEEKEAPEK